MGIAKANEVLILGRKMTSQDLLESRFVKCVSRPLLSPVFTHLCGSKIFADQSVESFHAAVHKHVQSDLDGLEPSAVLQVKQLIRTGLNEQNNIDAANLRESYAQATRLASGIPRERFAKIARKEVKHKL